jgi:hypothetical protein
MRRARWIWRSTSCRGLTTGRRATCDGRERWDDRSRLTYILMSNDGHSLGPLLRGAKPKGLSEDQHIIVDMTCHASGVTSPGGYYAEDGDTVTWKYRSQLIEKWAPKEGFEPRRDDHD